jgi:hypothetical protein
MIKTRQVQDAMKKIIFHFILLLSISCVTCCTRRIQHSDPFYNLNDNDFSRLPLINPFQAIQDGSFSPWFLGLGNSIWIEIPNSNNDNYVYDLVKELEKIAVKNGVIMAYSSYVDKEAGAYIQDNYYHWFVIIPDKELAKGFHTEDEFREYIQTLDIQNPDWQTPDEAYDKFIQTGCLEWIPDCK